MAYSIAFSDLLLVDLMTLAHTVQTHLWIEAWMHPLLALVLQKEHIACFQFCLFYPFLCLPAYISADSQRAPRTAEEGNERSPSLHVVCAAFPEGSSNSSPSSRPKFICRLQSPSGLYLLLQGFLHQLQSLQGELPGMSS